MPTEIAYTHKGEIQFSESKIFVSFVTLDTSDVPMKMFSLLLDTGAFITLIRKDRADQNGYQVFQENGCIIAGFSEKGLVCDLRKIPAVIFCGFRIDDVLVAAPHDDGISITEVLGMNILENFSFGLDFAKEEIYLNVRSEFESQKPKYRCGNVSHVQDTAL